jgi:hypothetical protein
MTDHFVPTPYASIADAMAISAPGDTIVLMDGYSDETTAVTVSSISIFGTSTSTGIELIIDAGVTGLVLTGDASIDVTDSGDGVTVVGNSGDNTIIVTGGIDVIDGGLGEDRLVVDYSASTAAITANAAAIGSELGTVGSAGIEHYSVLTGSGVDTLTFAGGNNYIDAGEGASTITVGAGNNYILTGGGVDTITVGSGDNYIDGGGGANTITVGAGNNFIAGGDGIDTITAMGGNNNIEAEGGANTVTTGIGNDVVATGNAADTVNTGDGNDILKDSGGAGALNAGAGHDRIILDFSAETAGVSNTLTGGGTYSGVIAATNFAGVEEFHITTGSGADAITTGDGADVLDGGAGADTLIAGGGSDIIYGGVGDVVDGGEDANGDDFDVLVLNDFGPHEIVLNDPLDSENGTVFQLDANGTRIGSMSFSNIERIEFVDTKVTTPEDTPLEGNLFVPTTTSTVTQFVVGTTTYVSGQTAYRTEGDLTINADGSFIFTPAPNYNGPGPVTTYTVDDGTSIETSSLIISVEPVSETLPKPEGVICFTKGTWIATSDGETLIENLAVGDLIQTLDHGQQPLRWIGCRYLGADELTENPKLRPIRICKNVVSTDQRVGDLVVSPQHRILVASKVVARMFDSTEVLVAAKHLLAIEGVDIALDFETVTYFHILLDQHEVIFANGVPAESLYLGYEAQKCLSLAGRQEVFALFPEVASPSFTATSCRPLIPNKRARQLALRHENNKKPLLDA